MFFFRLENMNVACFDRYEPNGVSLITDTTHVYEYLKPNRVSMYLDSSRGSVITWAISSSRSRGTTGKHLLNSTPNTRSRNSFVKCCWKQWGSFQSNSKVTESGDHCSETNNGITNLQIIVPSTSLRYGSEKLRSVVAQETGGQLQIRRRECKYVDPNTVDWIRLRRDSSTPINCKRPIFQALLKGSMRRP